MGLQQIYFQNLTLPNLPGHMSDSMNLVQIKTEAYILFLINQETQFIAYINISIKDTLAIVIYNDNSNVFL